MRYTMKSKEQIDTFIRHQIKDQSDPSISIAIVNDAHILYQNSFGYADIDKQILASGDTKYAIASCTKAFTATAIAILVAEGKVSWDELVKTYLPTFSLFDFYATTNMRVRDLLCHCSGLPRHDMAWYLNPVSRSEELQRIPFFKPNLSFREKWQYSNYMYLVAGQLIEAVSKKTWEHFIEDHIFRPLDMSHSDFSMHNQASAKGYKSNNNTIEAIPYYDFIIDGNPSLEAAGGICSTTKDLSKWLMMQLQNKPSQILQKEALKELYTPQMVVNDILPDHDVFAFSTYGLGWFIDTYRTMEMIHHSGSIDGFISWISFLPKQNLGIIILSNLDETKLPEALTYHLYDYLLDLSPIDWIAYYADKTEANKRKRILAQQLFWKQQVKNTNTTLALNTYEGIYENKGYGKIEVKIISDILTLQFKRREIPTKHYHYDEFVGNLLDDILPITFIVEEDKVKRMDIPLEPAEGAETISFVRID